MACRSANRCCALGNTSRSFAGSSSAGRRSNFTASTIRSLIAGRALPGSVSRSGASSTAIPPAGLRTAGKVADGTLPIFMSPEKPQTIIAPILEGMAKAGGGKTLADFDLAPYVRISMGEDLAACRDAVRPQLALYIGGMGARSKNFYNDLIKRLGYEAAAGKIQDHFLAGRRKEAEAAVPDALIDEISLVGTRERIRDRLQAWTGLAKDHRIGTLVLTGATPEALRVVAEAVL